MSIDYEEYNPKWIEMFETLKQHVEPKISSYILDFIHVGSTSIVGMSAKPIIDIDAVVKDFRFLDKIKNELESIGYIHQSIFIGQVNPNVVIVYVHKLVHGLVMV